MSITNVRRGSAAAFGLLCVRSVLSCVVLGCGGAAMGTDAGPADGGGSGGDAPMTNQAVVEIAIRRLRPGQELTAFESARDAFVTRLRAQEGVVADRELQGVFDYATGGPPEPAIYVGMTQYRDLAAFQSASEALGGSSEAGAFFATFEPITFTVLAPLERSTDVDLRGLAATPGQVLEIAVRDLSSYGSFDPVAYASTRDAFLALLTAQPGVVSEHQWRSELDPNLVVGMTVYASQEAFAAVAGSDAVRAAPETAAFLGAYPPSTGLLTVSIR
jgi:hypothetical protein